MKPPHAALASIFVPILSILADILFLTKFSSRDKGEKKPHYAKGPRPLPILGNLFCFLTLRKNPEQTLLQLAHKYGALCMLWFGSSPVVFISSAKVAKDLLQKRGSIYSSRPTQTEFRANAWPWRLLITPAGGTFQFLRKLYNTVLNWQQTVKLRKYQDFESKIFIHALLDNSDEFLANVERFALSVIFSACYGIRLAQLNHPIMNEFYSIWHEMIQFFQPGSLIIDYFPVLQRLPKFLQPWLKLAQHLREREMRFHRAFLHNLKKQIAQGIIPSCFASHVLQVQAEEGISDDNVCDILAMIIGAGAETTCSVLQTFFKVMALHPEAMQKAQRELDFVVGNSRLPDWKDERSLPYLRALIKEIHRWAPIANVGIPHATTQTDVYAGFIIPKGTIVYPNLIALSRDSDRYSAPDIFQPDRFLGDDLNASISAQQADYHKRDHFHYGFGRRLCQGIFVAEASLFIFISRTLWGFDIGPLKGEPPLDMNAKTTGSVNKPQPYRVRITSRGPAYEATIKRCMADAKSDIESVDDLCWPGPTGRG